MSKVYLHATLKLRIGGYEPFCEAMAKQVKVLEGYGWKLVGAWVTLIGRVYTVVDIWELPDANAYFDATAQWRQTAVFKEFRAVTEQVLDEEIVTMVVKAPYSP